MIMEHRQFNIKGNPHTFYFIRGDERGVVAWEEIHPTELRQWIIPPTYIKDAQSFLTSVSLWDQFKPIFDAQKNVIPDNETPIINTKVENIQNGAREVETIMSKIKVETPVDNKTLDKINTLIQTEVVVKRGRGRPRKIR